MLHTARERQVASLSVAFNIICVQNPTEDLRGTDEEVGQLVNMVTEAGQAGQPPVTVLKGAGATSDRVQETLRSAAATPQQPFALHFACHGTFDPSTFWSSHLRMGGGTRLTVGDLLDHDLRNCHLAVLSAYQTGLSHASMGKSTGAVSLASALLVAGVPRVLSSLWRVSDASAALLVTRVYHHLIKSDGCESLTSALRQAQQWLRGLSYRDAKSELGCILRRGGQRGSVSESVLRGLLTIHNQPQTVWLSNAAVGRSMDEELYEMLLAAVPHTAGCTTTSLGPSGAPADQRDNGSKFQLGDWEKFVEAHETGRATLLHSHLFPVENSDKTAWLCERDFWFRCEPARGAESTDSSGEGTDTSAASAEGTDSLKPWFVVLHVHFSTSWQSQDESLIAQINARFPNNPGINYQYEPHGAIQQGINTTAKMFRVTAVQTSPSKKNDPTKWMGAQDPDANMPAPWHWRDHPAGPSNRGIVMPDKPHVTAAG
eukprot:m.475769 g.475769  ORF g.475769 m.475769 type:complete len:487 (-) comp20398_c0_seq18:3234-4694(-)